MDARQRLIKSVMVIRNGQALVEAAHRGQLEIVGKILQSGIVDINFRDNHGRTAAYRAARRGHTEVLQFLIQHGADLATVTSSGASPAFVTAQQGEVAAMKLLLAAGTKINVPPAQMHGSPLGMAVSHGHTAMVELLVQAKADVTLPARPNVTRGPLHICIDNDDPQLLRLLFKGDIPTSLRDEGVKFAATSHSHRCLLKLYQIGQVRCYVATVLATAALDLVSSACCAHVKNVTATSRDKSPSVTFAQWERLRRLHGFGAFTGKGDNHDTLHKICSSAYEALYHATDHTSWMPNAQSSDLEGGIAGLSLRDADKDNSNHPISWLVKTSKQFAEMSAAMRVELTQNEREKVRNEDEPYYVHSERVSPVMAMLLSDVLSSRDRVTRILDDVPIGEISDAARSAFDINVRPISTLCSVLTMADAAACQRAQRELAILLAAKVHGGILLHAGFGHNIFGRQGYLMPSSIWLRHPIVTAIRETAFKFSEHYVSRYLRRLVGKRVKFSWSDGWYDGVVHSCNYEAQSIKVHFDDGDVLCYYVKGAKDRFRII